MLIDVFIDALVRLNNEIPFIKCVISNTINTYLIISSLKLTTYLTLQFSELRRFITCLRVIYYLYRLLNLSSIILLL